ncbi:MAG: family intrarane metalloprotease [Bacteroidetes bacterium]|nr:family intrarane metalloprotease [Bacteroidota bacterium]
MNKTTPKINWFLVSISYIIAFGISSLFNSGLLSAAYKNFTNGCLVSDRSFLPAGIGTLAAAGFAFYFDKNFFKTITFLGNDKLKNIAIALTPFVVFTITSLIQKGPGPDFILFAVFLIYAVTEEIFWRGYLQDALRPLGKNISYAITGVLWWAWHFRFNTFFDWTTFLVVCVASAYLLGKFTEETKSFLTAAGLHSLIIITTSTGDLTNSKIIAGIITILAWLGIGKIGATKKT